MQVGLTHLWRNVEFQILVRCDYSLCEVSILPIAWLDHLVSCVLCPLTPPCNSGSFSPQIYYALSAYQCSLVHLGFLFFAETGLSPYVYVHLSKHWWVLCACSVHCRELKLQLLLPCQRDSHQKKAGSIIWVPEQVVHFNSTGESGNKAQ